jgi:hypothetical protein
MARGERWLPIYGYTGLYEVSSQGRIRSLYGDRILRQSESGEGYLRVTLVKKGKRKTFFVQQIVCKAFWGPAPGPNYEVGHLDGDRKNNKSNNLEWVTKKQNAAHRRLHGNSGEGEGNSSAKLTRDDVYEILDRYDEGESASSLGREFGVSHTQILNIVKGKKWKHV